EEVGRRLDGDSVAVVRRGSVRNRAHLTDLVGRVAVIDGLLVFGVTTLGIAEHRRIPPAACVDHNPERATVLGRSRAPLAHRDRGPQRETGNPCDLHEASTVHGMCSFVFACAYS